MHDLPAYYDPETFRTCNDLSPALRKLAYERGFATGQRSREIGIGGNGTWYAHGRDGGTTTSFEKIGYHAYTADFWRGVLDSSADVFVYLNGVKHALPLNAAN